MIRNLPNLNPAQYAQKYAQENNVSINEAKVQLEDIYGAPKVPEKNQGRISSSYEGLDIFQKMEILNQSFESKEETDSNSKPNSILDFFQHMFQGFGQNCASKQNDNQKGDFRLMLPMENSNTSNGMKNPDEYAKEYMKQYNEENPDDAITFEEAKEILKEKYGTPEQR